MNGFSAAEKVLSRAPFLVDQTKPGTTSPLHVAAEEGHVDIAKILIKASINVKFPLCQLLMAVFLSCTDYMSVVAVRLHDESKKPRHHMLVHIFAKY